MAAGPQDYEYDRATMTNSVSPAPAPSDAAPARYHNCASLQLPQIQVRTRDPESMDTTATDASAKSRETAGTPKKRVNTFGELSLGQELGMKKRKSIDLSLESSGQFKSPPLQLSFAGRAVLNVDDQHSAANGDKLYGSRQASPPLPLVITQGRSTPSPANQKMVPLMAAVPNSFAGGDRRAQPMVEGGEGRGDEV